jgi:hypothetical protein
LIAELIGGAPRLALVGLAKNTGKTQALTSILREHAQAGVPVGVTSIGRDGEERDVIDARIGKPRIHLREGSLLASADALLRASGVGCERLVRTGVRTPLGEVVIARMLERGAVEVAGPSAREDVRAVSDAMLSFGAQQVLIDGSIDRRAACAPGVAGALVMATGAVLGPDVQTVAVATLDAVELIRLPIADLARHEPIALPGRVVLHAEPDEIRALLAEHPDADTFLAEGALGERFLQGLIGARRERSGRELRIVAADPTKVFLSQHSVSWYRRQGVVLEVIEGVQLKAITVNPVAPQSHHLDSARLREAIEAAVPGVPVLDVLDPSYAGVHV